MGDAAVINVRSNFLQWMKIFRAGAIYWGCQALTWLTGNASCRQIPRDHDFRETSLTKLHHKLGIVRTAGNYGPKLMVNFFRFAWFNNVLLWLHLIRFKNAT